MKRGDPPEGDRRVWLMVRPRASRGRRQALGGASSLLWQLPPNLAPRKIAGAGIDGHRAILGVDVDVGVAGIDRGKQVAERVTLQRPNQVGRRDGALGQHAIRTAIAGRPGHRRRAREQPHDNRPVDAGRAHMDVGHEGIVYVRCNQLVLQFGAIRAQLEIDLTLSE